MQTQDNKTSAESPCRLTEYLKLNQRGFNEQPFNEVDSLVLSSLVYLNFEVYPLSDLQKRIPVPLIDILRFSDKNEIRAGSWLKSGDDVDDFLMALARSVRYKDLSVRLYQLEVSENIDKQFAAATFTASGMTPYVAFRGTDGSIRGWREDFDLAYREIIPSHLSALSYLSGVLSCIKGPVIIGGHSKGGNLAEYAAAAIDGRQFGRIQAIYNHDGPNFLQDPTPRYARPAYKAKRFKLVPESSIFGMILEDEEDFAIVASDATSFFQHRPLTWLVSGTEFKRVESLSRPASMFDATLDAWLKSCTPQQREGFINAVFDLAASTQARSFKELQQTLPISLARILKESRQLDEETREAIKEALSHLGATFVKQRSEEFSSFMARMFSRYDESNSPSRMPTFTRERD